MRLANRAMIVSMLVFGGLVARALPAHAEVNWCSVNVQDPHYSQTHGGIDVTAVWQCGQVPTTIHLDQTNPFDGISPFLYLWVCPNNDGGAKDEYWIGQNCTVKGANFYYVTITVAGSNGSKDLLAPGKYQPAAHGTGWWIACTEWWDEGPRGTSYTHGPDFANWRYVSG